MNKLGMGTCLKLSGALDDIRDENHWFQLPRRPMTGPSRFGNGPSLLSGCMKDWESSPASTTSKGGIFGGFFVF